MELGHVNQI